MGTQQSLFASAVNAGDLGSVKGQLDRYPALATVPSTTANAPTPCMLACQPHSTGGASRDISEATRCALVKAFADAARAAVMQQQQHQPPAPARQRRASTGTEAGPSTSSEQPRERGGERDEGARAVRAMVNAPSPAGVTPLMMACQGGYKMLVALLLSLGADPWAVDKSHGRTALHYAAASAREKCITVLLRFESEQTSGRRRRLVDAETHNGYTPLFFAVAAGSLSSVRALLAFKPQLNIATRLQADDLGVILRAGTTALHVAALRLERKEIAVEILRHYATLRQAADADGSSAGSDPRFLVDAAGRTPAGVALRRNHVALAELLHPLLDIAAFAPAPRASETASGPAAAAAAAQLAAATLCTKLLHDLDACAPPSRPAVPPSPRARAVSAGGRTSAGGAAGDATPLTSFGNTCGVCLDDAEEVEIGPCKHRLCCSCARQVVVRQLKLVAASSSTPANGAASAATAPTCPYCRGDIAAFGGITADA